MHYAVHDAYDLDERRLRGHTVLTLRATEDLASLHLDLLLPVTSVRVDGRRAAYDRPNRHELRITPRDPLAAGETVRVRVAYDGWPGTIRWRGDAPWLADDHEVVTMGEPHMAAWWFPANDHPRDKASFDVSVTVPRDLQVVANGVRVSRRVHGPRATTHWRSVEPMAPYLAFFAAGRFAVRHGSDGGLPWTVAVSKAVPSPTRQRSMRLMLRTPGVVAWLEGELGDYPFAVTGGLTTSLAPGFALENQTRPTYPVLAAGSVGTVVHELAHQWFGDSVSVRDWRDVWLNEGAATFMEARWDETHGGRSAEQWLEQTYDGIDAHDDFWRIRVADPGPGRLFAWPVYVRGGMALEALRRRIDDEPTFWLLLRTWLADHRGGNGSTADFEALAEQVTGLDLDGFFRAWLHATSRPARTAANGLSGG
nr:M1 family metallopeptidase [Nocardioides luti]